MHTLTFLLLLLAHWAGDYTHLSTPTMLAAKRFGTPSGPIVAHALVHAFLAVLVVCITLPYELDSSYPVLFVVFSFMASTHFFIDLLKGKMNVWVPKLTNPANPYHWYVFGIDQTLHMTVLVLISMFVQHFI